MPNLLIIRGIPGSGKSTYAKSLLASSSGDCYLVTPNYKGVIYTHHYEADMFFIDNTGKYTFDKKYIKTAHEWCYNNTLKALADNNNVIVSNTFVKLWELDKYFNIKDIITNLNIELVEILTEYNSIHEVPEATIQRMKSTFEPFNGDKLVINE